MAEEEQEKQLARTLTNTQRDVARQILQYVSDEVERIANGDQDLAFRVRRYIHARIQMKNTGTSQQRQKRQKKVFDKQEGKCGFCGKPFVQLSGTEMHRLTPGRYTDANTLLVHRDCHQEHHLREGSEPEDE
jgi:5-methylcytosine-specific restriction endonuclease McrA